MVPIKIPTLLLREGYVQQLDLDGYDQIVMKLTI